MAARSLRALGRGCCRPRAVAAARAGPILLPSLSWARRVPPLATHIGSDRVSETARPRGSTAGGALRGPSRISGRVPRVRCCRSSSRRRGTVTYHTVWKEPRSSVRKADTPTSKIAQTHRITHSVWGSARGVRAIAPFIGSVDSPLGMASLPTPCNLFDEVTKKTRGLDE